MQEPPNHRFDETLREKFSGSELPPDDRIWAGLESRIGPPAGALLPRVLRYLLPFGAAILLLLTGNLLPRFFQPAAPADPAARQATHVTPAPASQPENRRPFAAAAPAPRQPQAPAAAPALMVRPAGPSLAIRKAAPARPAAAPSGPVNAPAAAAAGPAQAASAEPLAPPASAAGGASAGAGTLAPVVAIDLPVPHVLEKEPQAESRQTAPAATPAVLLPLLKQEQSVQQLLATGAGTDSTSRADLLAQLQLEKEELARLQKRADSLLLAYGAQPYVAADTATAQPQKALHRWSLLLTLAPERSFMHLQAPAADTLVSLRKNHEQGRAGANAALSLEYRLNERLSLGAGIGYTSYGSELRLTNRQTLVEVQYDTTTTLSTNNYTTYNTVYTLELDSTAILSPIVSGGQVVGYDTLYIQKHDTVYHTVTLQGTDTMRTQVITPLLHKREVTTYKVLRPQYHFVTLPVMVRFRLLPGTRWWADVAAGGQVQLFRGGTQLVTEDGRSYRTEKVGARQGPFRPVNWALMGSLSLNYALTERMSFSLAPAVRWQVQSVYKKETGLQQRPVATGLQFGLRYTL